MSEETQLQKQGNPTVAYLTNKLPQLNTILPKHITPEKFLRVVFVQMQKNPKLAQATRESIYASMMSAGERGLIPDGYHGHLVPFRKKDKATNQYRMECQFIPDYKGIMLLARQSGDVSDIFPASIRENDQFEYELGFDRKLVHRPNLLGNRGDVVAVYCVVELKDGTKTFGPGPMTVDEVERIRARSRSANDGPWVTDWEAQAWKTVIKRTLKFVAQSPELRSIIELDDSQYTASAPKDDQGPVTLDALMAGSDGEVTAAPNEQFHQGITEVTENIILPENIAVKPEWPQKRGDDWIDSAGQIFDKSRDGMGRNGVPSVNKDGTFRAKRRDAGTKQASPPQPAPEQASEIPGAHTVTPHNDRAKAAAGEIGSQEILEMIRKAETLERMDVIDYLIRELPEGTERTMCANASANRRRVIEAGQA